MIIINSTQLRGVSSIFILIAVFLILGTSCNSQHNSSNRVATNPNNRKVSAGSNITGEITTVTTNPTNEIASVKTLFKTPPEKSSGIAYYDYHYTDKFIPFLSDTFWKGNKDQPKDEPIRMQSYTETTSLEPGHTDIITILFGHWDGELLVLRKEKKGFTKVLGKKIFDGPCIFSNVQLMYLTNKEYPDFVVSCVSGNADNVMILQWHPPASLIPLFNEGIFRYGPRKTAKPVYDISPHEMKLYPNKFTTDTFAGNAMGAGVDIKKIGNEIEVIEHTVPTDNYYKWNGIVFELIKVVKVNSN